jgi:hypothetical protein
VGYVFTTNQAIVVVLFILLPLMASRWEKAHILATVRFIALPLIALLALGLPAWLAWPSFALALAAFRITLVTGDNIIVDIVPAAFRARAAGARYLGVSLGALLAFALIVFFGRRESVPGASASTVPQESA